MNPIDILMTVCLLSNPAACEQKTIPASEEVATLNQCMFWAQAQIAQWSNEHPKYKVVRWKCSYPSVDEPI